jgi:hypothetical protein
MCYYKIEFQLIHRREPQIKMTIYEHPEIIDISTCKKGCLGMEFSVTFRFMFVCLHTCTLSLVICGCRIYLFVLVLSLQVLKHMNYLLQAPIACIPKWISLNSY